MLQALKPHLAPDDIASAHGMAVRRQQILLKTGALQMRIGTDNPARKLIEEERKKLDQRLRDPQFYARLLIESNIDTLMTTDPADRPRIKVTRDSMGVKSTPGQGSVFRVEMRLTDERSALAGAG